MFVAQMDIILWNFWLERKSALAKPNSISYRTIKYPDHDDGRRNEQIQRIGWEAPNFPPLSQKVWYMKKWMGEHDLIYRTYINNIVLVHNSWTGLVRVEFEYDTWVVNPDSNKWQSV